MLDTKVLDKSDPDYCIFFCLFYDHVELYTILFSIYWTLDMKPSLCVVQYISETLMLVSVQRIK